MADVVGDLQMRFIINLTENDDSSQFGTHCFLDFDEGEREEEEEEEEDELMVLPSGGAHVGDSAVPAGEEGEDNEDELELLSTTDARRRVAPSKPESTFTDIDGYDEEEELVELGEEVELDDDQQEKYDYNDQMSNDVIHADDDEDDEYDEMSDVDENEVNNAKKKKKGGYPEKKTVGVVGSKGKEVLKSKAALFGIDFSKTGQIAPKAVVCGKCKAKKVCTACSEKCSECGKRTKCSKCNPKLIVCCNKDGCEDGSKYAAAQLSASAAERKVCTKCQTKGMSQPKDLTKEKKHTMTPEDIDNAYADSVINEKSLTFLKALGFGEGTSLEDVELSVKKRSLVMECLQDLQPGEKDLAVAVKKVRAMLEMRVCNHATGKAFAFKPVKSRDAEAALKNKKCGYDFLDNLNDGTNFLTRLENSQNSKAGKKPKKGIMEALEKDYEYSHDKLQCPVCKKVQSFDEYYKKKRFCTGAICNAAKFEKLNITTGVVFEKRNIEMEKKRVAKAKKIEDEMYSDLGKPKTKHGNSSQIAAAATAVDFASFEARKEEREKKRKEKLKELEKQMYGDVQTNPKVNPQSPRHAATMQAKPSSGPMPTLLPPGLSQASTMPPAKQNDIADRINHILHYDRTAPPPAEPRPSSHQSRRPSSGKSRAAATNFMDPPFWKVEATPAAKPTQMQRKEGSATATAPATAPVSAPAPKPATAPAPKPATAPATAPVVTESKQEKKKKSAPKKKTSEQNENAKFAELLLAPPSY